MSARTGQILAALGLSAPGRADKHNVHRILPRRCVQQILQNHFPQAGTGDRHAQRHTGVVSEFVGQQRNKLREAARGGGVAELPEPGGLLSAGIERPPQRRLAALPAFRSDVVAPLSADHRLDGVLRVCASAAAAAITTDAFTPRSAVPRLSSEISSLPEASFRTSSSSVMA